MILRLLATGTQMPAWVNAGFNEYARRFTAPCSLTLIEVAAEKRYKNADIPRIVERESEKLLKATKSGHRIIALDVRGKTLTTESLAEEIRALQTHGTPLDLLIGGPDGLSPACLARAHERWSLSPMTLPHPLVRILIAEQLYRAISLLQGHPYHRG